MSVYGAMRTSVSGMNVQADRLSTIADNLANVGTTAYKSASVEFSTLVLQGSDQSYESGAVESHVRRNVEQQGTFNYTGSETDLAIFGDGFFLVQGADDQIALTRAGSFIANEEGALVNAAGYALMGYSILGGDAGAVVNGTAGLEPVNTRGLSLSAVPSSDGRLQANLPADGALVAAADLPSANGATAQYSARTSLVAYDNLGAEVTLDFLFARTAANEWEVTVFDRATASATGGFPYSSGPVGAATLSFDGTTGRLSTTSASSVSFTVPNGRTVNFDLATMSQFASDFAVVDAGIDGSAAVPVSHMEISAEGVLTAVYQNGARVDTYRIPIGHVTSPNNLTALSGNVFLPSTESGAIQIGWASDSGYGSVVSGALEQSTVDIASELTAMIEAQRNYTANSRVFQTGADMMDVVVNLRR